MPRATSPIPELATDSLTDHQQPERKDERDDDEHYGEAALGTAPFLPVGYPVTHTTAPPNLALIDTDRRGENSTELCLSNGKGSVNLP